MALRNLIFALAGLALAACGSTPAPVAPEIAEASPAPQTVQEVQQAQYQADLAYRLDSGDRIRINVYGEPDLSGEYELDGQGSFQMSLIGEVNAANKTIRELQSQIEMALRDGQFIREPQVAAEVITYRPFYILGEVNNPGEYPYTSGLTVMNAIASAGDFTYRADKRRVLIKSVDSSTEREVDLTVNTPVRPGDTIRVRERFF